MRRRQGARLHKVHYRGLAPAATFGAKANGFSNAELRRLRAAVMAVAVPKAPSASLAGKLALHLDRAWIAAVGPLLS
eukprot:11078289-Lingulodinium_polyedra.AAC.1